MRVKTIFNILVLLLLLPLGAFGQASQRVANDHGKQAIRADQDVRISMPEHVKVKKKCFIVMSKKDFYLYVYEAQGPDTVLVARYDACFSLKKGQKQRKGDMKTPHCTFKNPFKITQIVDASKWKHDFGDGRGSILSYGHWFMRLQTWQHQQPRERAWTSQRRLHPSAGRGHHRPLQALCFRGHEGGHQGRGRG